MADDVRRERRARRKAPGAGPVPTGPMPAHLLLRVPTSLVPTRPPTHLLHERRARFPNLARPHAPTTRERRRELPAESSPSSPLPFRSTRSRGHARSASWKGERPTRRASGRTRRFAAAGSRSFELRAPSSRSSWRSRRAATSPRKGPPRPRPEHADEAANEEGEETSDSAYVRARGGSRPVCPSDDVHDRTDDFGGQATRPLERRGPVALRPGLSAGLPLSRHRKAGKDTYEFAIGPIGRANFRRRSAADGVSPCAGEGSSSERAAELDRRRASGNRFHANVLPAAHGSTKSSVRTSSGRGGSASGEWIVSRSTCSASGNAARKRFALPGSFSKVATTSPL